jgi:16S rRNA (cytosine967-C5)-methyltransferase
MLAPQKLKAQTRAVIEASALLLWQCLVRRQPADRVLAAHLRGHKEFGSRDRRLISETAYALFRWWGWLKPLTPPQFLQRLEAAMAESATALGKSPNGNLPAPDPLDIHAEAGGFRIEQWAPLLLGVQVVERIEAPDMAECWGEACGLSMSTLGYCAAPQRPVTRANRYFEVLAKSPKMAERNPAPAAPVLKTLKRELRDIAGLEAEADAVKQPDLGLHQTVPAWVAPEIALPPKELQELLEWLQRRPPLWVRIQGADRAAVLAELAEAKLFPEPHPKLENAVAARNSRVNFYTLPAYREGRVEIQDLASQCIGSVCAPKPGERWWDVCAGAGGKSLLLAQLMQGKGVVVAADIRAHKLEDLKLRARRGGFFNITPKPWDGKPVPARKATYDGVLVDAPCSCSGTWRRNPAARWSTDLAEVAGLAATQLQILQAAATGVKPGGVLVYATCSLFRRENEEVVRAFADSAPEFELEPFVHPLTGAPTPGFVQFWPWEGDCDAMFAARFRRRDGTI